MPRLSRVVLPGCWHHVTQRGNHRQTVFLHDAQREFYLRLLAAYTRKFHVGIGGYCLMGNHVHLLAIPSDPQGLARALGRTHNDYARWLHVQQGLVGHLWQNRFFSCPLDDAGRWEALRYIELNPVRAGLVGEAASWPWSSAAAHQAGTDRTALLSWDEWRTRWSPEGWREALAAGIEDAALIERIRQATRTGRPAGSAAFVRAAEMRLGRRLAPVRPGPKPKAVAERSGVA